jgi:iron(III) transport system permease protein
MVDTLSLALIATLASVAIGLWFALAGRRAGRDGRRWGAPWIVSLCYVLPAAVLGIAMLFLASGLKDTPLGPWLAGTSVLLLVAVTLRYTAFAYFSVETGFAAVSKRLDEAVSCVGRGRLHALVHVLLPLARGPVLVGATLVFVNACKELTLPMVLQPFDYGSLALSVHHFASIDLYRPGAVYALCLVLIVVYPVLSIGRWLGGR